MATTGARTYLDNAATTEPLPEVVAEIARVQRDCYGNPSSAHAFGHEPKRLLEDAREFLRGTLHAADLVFTGSGTEADQLGVVGAALARPRGRVLCGAADHPAVLRQKELLQRLGYELTAVPVTRDGDIHPERLFDLLGQDVRVVALLHGHNELGTLCRLEELVELVRRTAHDAHVHVDLVQSYAKIAFDLDTLDVDSVAVSGHKLHGPRGVGFLARASTARIAPINVAGGQEHGLRGGTENVAGVVGLMRAAEEAFSSLARTKAHCEDLATAMFARVQSAFPDAERLGHAERRLPHILSLRIPGVVAHTLLEALDHQHGIAFSTGAACHGETQSTNHVHEAMGLDKRASREVMRFSFSRFSREEEVRRAAEALVAEAQRLVQLAPVSPATQG